MPHWAVPCVGPVQYHCKIQLEGNWLSWFLGISFSSESKLCTIPKMLQASNMAFLSEPFELTTAPPIADTELLKSNTSSDEIWPIPHKFLDCYIDGYKTLNEAAATASFSTVTRPWTKQRSWSIARPKWRKDMGYDADDRKKHWQ